MKKTLVTTAAVLALAGTAAAPAAAGGCLGGGEQASSTSTRLAVATSQESTAQSAAPAQNFQSVGTPQISAQTVSEAAAPIGYVAPQSTPASVGQSASTESSSFSDQVAQEMLAMINQDRANAGLQPLSANDDLTGIAAGWSQQMAGSNSASHSPTFIDQTLATGSTNMAENVAYDVTSGKSAQETAQYFYNFWMNSPGHYANIMNPELNAIGFSLAESSNGYVYATQNFGTY
ncbi:MAG: CAP domain-containing protein [Kocuria sp.]|nr:CAP domain-containing protein [Kocuria sp.]